MMEFTPGTAPRQAPDRHTGGVPAPDPASEVIDLLRTFTIETQRFVDVFARAHGLHPTDLNAVAHISEAHGAGHPLTPGELSRALSLSPSATTALLGRLERAGHVERVHDTEDRRRVHLRMRPSAEEVAQEFFLPLGHRIRDVLAGYRPDEVERITVFLRRAAGAVAAAADEAHGAASGDHASDRPH